MYRVWSENPSGNAKIFLQRIFFFLVKTQGPCLRISGKKRPIRAAHPSLP